VSNQKTKTSNKIFILALCAVLCALSFPAEAQQPVKIPRIVRLSPTSAAGDAPVLAAFRQGLRNHGWVERRNIAIDYRFADGKREKLAGLAAEIAQSNPDVILTGATWGAEAAKRATQTIPIVMVTTGDPVASGLVNSLARPGGNLTGVTALGQELSGKRLQLLKEAVPNITRVAVLSNPTNPDSALSVKEAEIAARELGVQLQVYQVDGLDGFHPAFRRIANERAGALIVLTDPMFLTHRKRIVELTNQSRVPAMYPISEFANAGGLMFYGASFTDMYRRTATYVHKILNGAKPADLPIERAQKFDLVINLKAAKQIGLTIPPNVLARADRVIR